MTGILIFYTLPCEDEKFSRFDFKLIYNYSYSEYKESEEYNEIKDNIIKYWTLPKENDFTLNVVQHICELELKALSAYWEGEFHTEDDVEDYIMFIEKIFEKQFINLIIEHIGSVFENGL